MYKVLDTNIILDNADNVLTLAKEATVVLPETVLDEVDSKKSGHSEIAYQARAFGRLFSKFTYITSNISGSFTYHKFEHEELTIYIVSCNKYPFQCDEDTNIRNDRRIIHIAKSFYEKEYPRNTEFISNDVMCRIRANSLGIPTSDFKTVETVDMVFTKTYEVSPEIFSEIHNTTIQDIDPEHLPENYNYVFTNPETGQTKIAVIENNLIKVLGKEASRELHIQDVKPENSRQELFSHAIQDPLIDIVVCEARAGTGKTLLALSNAIKLVRRKETPYNSIIYIRASVDDVDREEEVGYLSGNDEKMAVYLHPFYDSLDFIMRSRLKDSKLKGKDFEDHLEGEIDRLITQCNMQAMTTLGLRGRTFKDTVIILDESQNQSKASLQKTLTRFGANCKIIIIGSNNQIDNPYLTKFNNGLSTILNACTKLHDNVRLHAINLQRVVRGSIAEFAEELFTNERN